MRIQVEGDLYLTGDKMGYSIVKKNVTKTGDNAGNELFMPLGHYLHLSTCIMALLKLKLSDSTAADLSELLNEVRQHREFVETKFVKELGK